MTRIRKLSATLLALLLVAGGAHASPLSLSDLFQPGAFVIIGNTRFDNWTQISYDTNTGRNFNAANMEVIALADGGMNPGPGLRFSVSGGELTVQGNAANAKTYLDLKFGFHVSVLDPTLGIKDNTLEYSSGGAFTSVLLDGSFDVGSLIREDIGTAVGLQDLGTKNIEFSTLENSAGQTSISKRSDSAIFAPQSEIWVTKDLYVWATDTTDSAGIFGFEQRFSQLAIPEPATTLLIGLGALGLGWSRRKRA